MRELMVAEAGIGSSILRSIREGESVSVESNLCESLWLLKEEGCSKVLIF
jgi:hypothetical protein